MDWVSGSCLLARVLEVFGDGRLKVLESRFGEVLVLVGLVERVFDNMLLTCLQEIVMMGKTDRMCNDEIEGNVTAAQRGN
jgi:hypothetical protein